MRRQEPSVGVVILNWRRPEAILACLNSLGSVNYPALDVVVVDNGSANGSPAQIRRQFSHVTVIENGRNLGYAAGCNVGIAYLLGRGADYVLLLNDDTEVAPDLLRQLVAVGESNPTIGLLGPKIYYHSHPNVIWSAGGAVDALGQPRHLRVDELDGGEPEPVRDVGYATGCGLLVKRHVIERIGALDERFFAYFEETEWCSRAQRAGFRVVYVPQAHMWHKLEPNARAHSRLYHYLMARNRLLYLRCSGAPSTVVARATLDILRTATSWTLKPDYRELRPFAPALLHAVTHFAVGRFGPPPAFI
jgi:GT2 family glycosyltransferase